MQRYDGRERLVFVGVLLYCGTMLMYILRETSFPDNLVFTPAGQLVIVSFSVLEELMKALPSMLLGLYATAVTIHAIYNLLVMHSTWGKPIAVLFPIITALALLLLFHQDQFFEPDPQASCDAR